MFCTIEDAWGSKDLQHSSFSNNNPDKSINTDNTFNKEMFEQSDKPESFKSNEYTFEDKSTTNDKNTSNDKSKQDMYSKYMELREMFESNQVKDSEVCLALDNHLSKCERCRSKYLIKSNNQQYNSSMSMDFSKINLNLDSNKDVITIFLFGLLIILLLQLFSSK
jgi:C-terminal processing protease CtpA/Prc